MNNGCMSKVVTKLKFLEFKKSRILEAGEIFELSRCLEECSSQRGDTLFVR
jgi:hypothetical protein